MPTENDDPNKSVALALQRVFYELQHRFVEVYNSYSVGPQQKSKHCLTNISNVDRSAVTEQNVGFTCGKNQRKHHIYSEIRQISHENIE